METLSIRKNDSISEKDGIGSVKIRRKNRSIPSSIMTSGKSSFSNLFINKKVDILPQDKNIIDLNNRGYLIFEEKISEKIEKLQITELNSFEEKICLPESDLLVTNIFLISSKKQFFPKLTMSFFVSPIKSKYEEFYILNKHTKNSDWETKPISNIVEADNGLLTVEFNCRNLGYFAVKTQLKFENILIDKNGCLYLSKLSRYLTIRIPRKAIDNPVLLTVKIFPLDITAAKKSIITNRAADYVDTIGDLFVLETNNEITLNKTVSLKLPLPESIIKSETDNSQFNVMMFIDNQWNFCSTITKFTKTSVTINTNCFGKFCVVKIKKYKNNFEIGSLIDETRLLSLSYPLDILVLLNLTKQKWMMRILVKNKDIENELSDSECLRIFIHQVNCPTFLLPNTEIKFSVEGNVKNDDFKGCMLTFNPLIDNNYFDLVIKPEDERCEQISIIKIEIFEHANSPRLIEREINFAEKYINEYLDNLAENKNLVEKKQKEKELAANRKKQLEEEKRSAEVARRIRRENLLNGPRISNYTKISHVNVSSKLKDYIEGKKTLHAILHTMEAKVLRHSSLRVIALSTSNIVNLVKELGVETAKIQSLYFDLYTIEDIQNFSYKLLLKWKHQKIQDDDDKIITLVKALRKISDNELANIVEFCRKKNIELTNEILQEMIK